MRKFAAIAVGAILVASCASTDRTKERSAVSDDRPAGSRLTEDQLRSFVGVVQLNELADEYDNRSLHRIANDACRVLKSTDRDEASAERALEKYERLSRQQRELLVNVAAGEACPDPTEDEVYEGPYVATDAPEATPEGARLRAVAWFLRVPPRDSENSLEIVYEIGGVASECQRYGDTRVRYPEGRLIVEEWVLVWPDRENKCPDEPQYSDSSIEWPGAPLGERKLSGCRPGRTEASEDRVCRDPDRLRTTEEWPIRGDGCRVWPDGKEYCISTVQ